MENIQDYRVITYKIKEGIDDIISSIEHHDIGLISIAYKLVKIADLYHSKESLQFIKSIGSLSSKKNTEFENNEYDLICENLLKYLGIFENNIKIQSMTILDMQEKIEKISNDLSDVINAVDKINKIKTN